MATALQCPACGHKHRIDGPQASASFPCSSCGQPLKVPAQFVASAAPAATIGSTNGSGTAAPSVSRPIIGHNQHKLPTKTDAAPAASVGTDLIDEYDDDFIEDDVVASAGRNDIGAKVRLTRSQRRAVMERPLPWWGRALVWIAALPVAAVLVLVPMRLVHFLSGSYLLGILSETGIRRFGRLAITLIAWSIVTALLVQATMWFFRRRRIGKIQEAAGATVDLALAEELSA